MVESFQQPKRPDPPKRGELEVYTMPEKFHVKDARAGKSSLVVKLVIAVLIVGGLVAVGIYAFQKYLVPPENENIVTNTVAVVNNANINGQTNQNVNAVTNGNLNTNANVNTNQNTNLNTNQNLNLFNTNNGNQNTNLNANIELPPARDSDSDGLTDAEETLFATDFQKADSDGDTYIDGQEVRNGYNPAGQGKIEQQKTVTLYSSSVGYAVLYPASFTESPEPQNPDGVLFTTTTGEFFAVSIQDNPAALSAKDWYLSKSPGIDSTKIETVQNWDKTLLGATSVDGQTVYYVRGTKAYVLNYNTNVLTEAAYSSAFAMFYQSFKFVTGTTTNINTNQNTNINTNLNTNTNVNTNANTNTNTNANSNANSNTNTNNNTNSNTNTNTNTNSNTNANANTNVRSYYY